MSQFQLFSSLLHRYAALIDEGELDEVGKLLEHCTIFDPVGNVLASGQEEVAAMYKAMVRIYSDSGTPRTQHVVNNFSVLDESDLRATTSAYFHVLQRLSSGKIETIICGRYKNVFKRIDGEWAFVEHHMTPIEIGDMSEHLLITL